MGISCCYGCVPPERTPYCHATCEKYKMEQQKAEAEKAEIKTRTIGSELAKRTLIQGCIKWRKIRRRRK